MGYLEEIQSRGRDANPFFRLMGIDVDSFCRGEAELSMDVRPDMLNGVGWLQGGLFTALCDEAMALALFTVIRPK
jgi:acyl-CoA thioesterase